MTAADEWTFPLVARDDPCSQTSPLLSYGVGTAFACDKPKGHDGQHGCVIKWSDGNAQVGYVEACWAKS